MDTFEIDSERNFTPFRSGNGKLHYTDHYSIDIIFKNLPLRQNDRQFVKKCIIWNTNKPGGWETYNELLENNENLINISDNTFDDPETLMKVIDKEINNAKYKAFGKVKQKTKDKCTGEIVALQKEKLNTVNNGDEAATDEVAVIVKKLAISFLTKQQEMFESRIKCLIDTKSKKGMSATVFN